MFVRWHSLDHPIAELGKQLEVRLLLVVEHGREGLDTQLLGLLVVSKCLEHLGGGVELGDNVICITSELDALVFSVKLVEFVLDFFAPMQVFGSDFSVLVHVVEL